MILSSISSFSIMIVGFVFFFDPILISKFTSASTPVFQKWVGLVGNLGPTTNVLGRTAFFTRKHLLDCDGERKNLGRATDVLGRVTQNS